MVTRPVTLDFLAWTWNPDLVRENLDMFERTVGRQDDLAISVTLTHYDWADYPEKLEAHQAAGKPIDVLYVSDDWLSDWAAAGRIVPIEDHRPQIRDYARDFEEFDTQGMTCQGKLYGLPYYCDRFGLVYNEAILQDAGIQQPPRTWDELISHCKAITAKTGLEHPLTLPFGFGHGVSYPVSVEAFLSLVYSRPDGWCFTPELEPLFDRGTVADEVLQWCLRAQDELGILDPACSDQGMEGVGGSLHSGRNAFGIVATYCLKELNAGGHARFKLAPMPETGYTVGYTRFYAVGSDALQRGTEHFEAAWRLVEFLGGRSDPEQSGRKDYYAMRRWILEDGLGFAQTSLFADPDVQQALGQWVDVDVLRQQAVKVKHKRGMAGTCWRPWYVSASEAIRAVMKHEMSCEQALKTLRDRWNELRSG